jgi:hypothetical protein
VIGDRVAGAIITGRGTAVRCTVGGHGFAFQQRILSGSGAALGR